MTVSIYLDNNVWNFLFDRKLDLAVELPYPDFCLCLTREAEFEIPPIPPDKAGLKAFIETTIARCNINTDVLFGFHDDSLPIDEQRVGGFDVGRWASRDELTFIQQQRKPLEPRPNPKTKLYKNEADISLAARAFHSVVLSLDAKSGPINDAYRRGGKVVFLTNFDESGKSLRDFIEAALPQNHLA
jgi:hypothetical protein